MRALLPLTLAILALAAGTAAASHGETAPLPDLVVEEVGPVAPPELGGAVRFRLLLRNDGPADAGPFVARFVVNNRTPLEPDVAVPGLAAGARLEVTSAPWVPNSTGDQVVEGVADLHHSVGEAHEGLDGNVLFRGFRVAGGGTPDLVAIDLREEQRYGGWSYRAVVRNDGDGTAGLFRVRFNVNLGFVAPEVAVEGLGPFGTAEVASGLWRDDGKPYRNVIVHVDVGHYVLETNETNNARDRDLRDVCVRVECWPGSLSYDMPQNPPACEAPAEPCASWQKATPAAPASTPDLPGAGGDGTEGDTRVSASGSRDGARNAPAAPWAAAAALALLLGAAGRRRRQ